MGFNSTFATGSFHDNMAKIRSRNLEGNINDQAVRDFSVRAFDRQKLETLLQTIRSDE